MCIRDSLQFAEHRSPQRVFGQHPLDGDLDDALRGFLQQFVHGDGFDIADVTGGPVIDLVGPLPAGRPHFLGIDHDLSLIHI